MSVIKVCKMKIDDAKIRETSNALKKPLEFSGRTSAFNDKYRSEITYLSTSQLVPYKNQARVVFVQDEIDALAETIKEHGIRQPLTVLRIDSDIVRFEVISGERRLRAARQIGLQKVPCIIIIDEEKAEEIALIENIQRQDLHPIELARTLKKLIDKIGYGAQLELQHKIGLSQPKISELVKLLTLPLSVQDVVLKRNYSGRDNLRKLLAFNTEEDQLAFLGEVKGVNENSGLLSSKNKFLEKSQSLLRLSLVDNEIRTQKNKISSLSLDKKKELVKILRELLLELEDI